jgi:hypothetical protein
MPGMACVALQATRMSMLLPAKPWP